MDEGTASSYYQPIPDKIPLKMRINLLRRVNYWKLVPLFKLLNGKRYKREAEFLITVGLIQTLRFGVPIKYEIKNGIASFDISPNLGENYLNYSRGKMTGKIEDDTRDLVNSIATIEARIKTKTSLILY